MRVTVHQQPDLTTEARVNEKRHDRHAADRRGQGRRACRSRGGGDDRRELKKGKFLKNPQVTVALTTLRSRQVSVLGLVARPGRYALDDTSSQLADVIAAAGGITPPAPTPSP